MTVRYAEDYTALHLAIRGIVLGETLGHRSIAPRRFRWGPHRVATQDMEPGAGDTPRTVQVVYGPPQPHPATPMNHTGDYRFEIVPVTVQVLYHLAGGNYRDVPNGGDLGSIQIAAMNDGAALIGALGHAGNLVLAPNGLDTGLASGRLERGETIEPIEDIPGGRYVAQHRFQAWVQLAQREIAP